MVNHKEWEREHSCERDACADDQVNPKSCTEQIN